MSPAYGPNGAQVERFLERLKKLTPEDWMKLAAKFRDNRKQSERALALLGARGDLNSRISLLTSVVKEANSPRARKAPPEPA